MDDTLILICSSAELEERGKGVRFPVTADGEDAIAFVIRHNGIVHAYLNRCAHVSMELDWNEGDFFESSRLYLMCATHGAIYEPDSGKCAGGPCRGGRLRKILVQESNNQVFWIPDEYIRPAMA
ncbi:Rieske (2Fe-2S) protein [Paraherbaspirillum soli]|uniref:Rieske (2Fe-2S) protein n=1 Tax=Paraherbaspirillum soli TaxID=631222 RepID=A0ABW0MAP5_9BURK